MKKLIITGNLGKDPEKRADQNGNQFATFSVAVAVGTKDNPKTDWVDVSCGGKLADVVCSYLKKGNKVLVTGFPSVNAYTNKNNEVVGTLRVYADDIEFLTPKDVGQINVEGASKESTDVNTLPYASNATTLESDQIPF